MGSAILVQNCPMRVTSHESGANFKILSTQVVTAKINQIIMSIKILTSRSYRGEIDLEAFAQRCGALSLDC